ncbi:hypothetical protein [Paenibacillus sp. P46E]|uniref:hypothetical protein n=1 Tax=Paenibacillus sp. P46E TaxID=1349436 RepID=UPI00093E28E1|nr:hypothetical protein [Paenibacillus sp. P46E]OKP97020.1 hypothetical protein A3849_17890 [Paenibacillus sp. P46E]
MQQSELENARNLHEKADAMNLISTRWDRPVLLCGAKRKRVNARCKNLAGMGTEHLGYGRCKFCGGKSTGPKTDGGKAAVSQNPRKHGFYSPALHGQEKTTYEKLRMQMVVTLEDEIHMWKAKLLTYLKKWESVRQEKGEEATRVWFKDGNERAYYYAATAEDRVVSRNLETIGRLVEKHARLTQESGDDLLTAINKELQQASESRITVSWGGKAQSRTAEKPLE